MNYNSKIAVNKNNYIKSNTINKKYNDSNIILEQLINYLFRIFS